jgi:DNA replication and repair protein RecF
VLVDSVELVDFRNYEELKITLTAGTTAILGRNGQGKTNLAEAISFLATLESFRGAPNEALVRRGADRAYVRADVIDDDGRRSLIECEIARSGPSRVQVNRQRLPRTRDLLGVIRTSVFSPDDLVLVKGSPGERRRFLDTSLTALAVRNDALRRDLDRAIRQRSVLLRQSGGRLDESAAATLDVWDGRMAELGDLMGTERARLVERLEPLVIEAYSRLAGVDMSVRLDYDPEWRRSGLADALARSRQDDLRRGVSTVGPHRDELEVELDGMPARTHASQGEQRTLALALRLAAHRLIAERVGSTPILVLDDVLSELDEGRATALLDDLPAGQIVITSAAPLPEAARPDRVIRIADGAVTSGG